MARIRISYLKSLFFNQLALRHMIYGSLIVLILFISAVKLANLTPYAEQQGLQYFRAEVVNVQNTTTPDGQSQDIQAKVIDGKDNGRMVSVSRNVSFGDTAYRRLPIGSDILLTKDTNNGGQYLYGDRWHLPGVGTLFLILLTLVLVIGGWRGITSILGLVISIGVISAFILPRIVDGYSALSTCIEGAFIISAISIYVAHGFSKRTTIAFTSSIVTLFAVVGLVWLATYLTGISEVTDENTIGALYSTHPISLSDLLTGGIIIASLGVLYDITTGQAAAVDEIYKANKKQRAIHLYKKGLSVGREHIAALVNTLALVYVGAALPSIILLTIYNHAPLLVVLNDEAIVEEIVRTCVASMGMLLAVPLTTGLAAYILPRWYNHYPKDTKTSAGQ